LLKNNQELVEYYEYIKKLGVNALDHNANTLLHLAVLSGDLKKSQLVTLFFKEHGQAIDQVNNDGKTALQLADEHHYLDIYFWLKDANISLYKEKEPIGEFYHNLRMEGENTECLCYVYDTETKKFLLNFKYL